MSQNPKQKPKRKKKELEEKIIVIPNPDKEFHETWDEKPTLESTGEPSKWDFPHPFRICMCAKPNCGKTLCIKNIVIRQNPEFEKIYVIHADRTTKEYDDIEPTELLTEIPDFEDTEYFDPTMKTLLILEDMEFRNMKKPVLANLDRLFGNKSTHGNLSIICVQQNGFSIPPAIRRMTNIFVVWKMTDMMVMQQLLSRLGINKDKFFRIIEGGLLDGPHDSLWIDNTIASPWPYRINAINPLTF